MCMYIYVYIYVYMYTCISLWCKFGLRSLNAITSLLLTPPRTFEQRTYVLALGLSLLNRSDGFPGGSSTHTRAMAFLAHTTLVLNRRSIGQ